MIFDMHAHLFALDSVDQTCFLRTRWIRGIFCKALMRKFSVTEQDLVEGRANRKILEKTLHWITSSQIDRVVLLAFDKAYDQKGNVDDRHTQMYVGNEHAAQAAQTNNKVLFGASINPYRRDALDELERVREAGAVLVKWLPSAQNIKPNDPACFPFYERLATLGIPLLSHLGNEHFFSGINSLNSPSLLEPALQRGVTVIGAHLGTRMMLHERSYFKKWTRLVNRYGNFFGDISAFGLPVRATNLRRICSNNKLSERLLFGSDFPALTLPESFLGRLSPAKIVKLRRLKNPFDKAYLTFKEAGVPSEVFSRPGLLLKMPSEKLGEA